MKRHLAGALLALATFTTAARAQVGGAIAGKVTDASNGRPLSDVRVEISGEQR